MIGIVMMALAACQGLAACLLDVPKDFDSTYVSPKLVLDKPSGATAYYRLTFDAKSPVEGYWWVDFYDRADALLPDVNSRLYASGGFIPYDVVVPASPEAVTAVVKFSLKKPNVAQVRDLKMRRISVDEAAAWCARTYAAGPQLVPFETAGSWERLPKTRKALTGGKRRFDVVLLGDSLMNDSYCGLLGVQMQKVFPDVDLRVHISVRGSTGCWYYHEKDHFEECVAKYRPDLVLIGGISNHQTNRVERYRANRALVEEDFVETIERCKAIGAEVIVCTPPKSVEFRTSPEAKDLPADFNDESTAADCLQLAFERRAAARTGVQLWDLNGPTCRTVALSGKPLGWFNRDAVHNDDRGKQLIAQAFGAYFRAALEPALRPTAFRLLAPGQVRAERWLLRQLELQRDGLTGHAEELFDDIGNSDWLTGEGRGGQYAWERGPYYLKGLVSLAYVMDDAALKAKARRWIESILKSQRENGDFGPRDCNWWANMIVLHLMRDYFEATGDARALAFLERYFEFQREALKTKPLGAESIWADQRGGDELEVVLWLCGREGGAKWLDFARLVADQTRRVRDNGRSTNGTGHIVNFMQGLKAPALKWRLGGEGAASDAYWRVFGPEGREFLAYGRPDRMLNGSETFSDNRASEGTELCAIVERILSSRTILEVSGDAGVADDLESVAYNALPATLPPDLRGTRYYNVLNQPVCDERLPKKMQANGAGAAVCPGPEAGFGCCRSNWHFGWPKFVSSLWMAADEGLAAVAYGPCRVKAKAADGEVEIREETDYPFRETVALTVMSVTATRPFELKLRIPGWCTGARLAVNGEAVRQVCRGSFATIGRLWKTGDRIELKLPMRTEVRNGWVKNSSAVLRGPLVYARPIAFRREQIGGAPDKGFPKWRLVPTEGWGEALVSDGPHPGWKVVEHPVAEQPFDPATPAVTIEAEAVDCTAGGWGTMVTDPGDTGRAVEPPWGIWPPPKGGAHPYRLQPVGATELRITLFLCTRCGKRKPWLVLNEDNDHFFKNPTELMTEEALKAYVDDFARGHVTHFFMCPVGQRASYDSKVWEPIWAGMDEPGRKDSAQKPDGTHDIWCVNCKKLHDAGIDPYAVWTKRCREKGVSPWVTMRMNDVHFCNITNYFRNTTFCRTRRDLWLNPETDFGEWAESQLNYAKKEVRDCNLAVVREMAERWDIDGFELDWMRFGYCLRPGHEAEDAHFVTEFVRDVRTALDEIGAKKGRRIALGTRVCYDPDVSRELGMDVEAWARLGLLDVIVPHSFLSVDASIPVAKWKSRIGAVAPGVKIVPGIDSARERFPWKKFPHDLEVMRPSDYRGVAEIFRRGGADGVYLFNLPYNGKWPTDGYRHGDMATEVYERGLDPDETADLPRTYPPAYHDFPFAFRPAAPRQSDEIRAAIQPFIDRGEIAGIVSILSDDELNLTVDCFGWADAENRVPMTPDTVFAVFSMTKTVTGCALMCAIDRGLLSMDDPVEKYVPEFRDVSWLDVGARCIEVASGMKFEDFVRKNIFNPLGMTSTGFNLTPDMERRLVKPYTTEGGLFSTPRDFTRFSQMLAHHGLYRGTWIVSRETFDRIWAVKQTAPGVKEPYSVGAWLYGDWMGHEGAMRTDQRANLRTGHSRLFFIQTENKAGRAFFDAKAAWHKAADAVQGIPATEFKN